MILFHIALTILSILVLRSIALGQVDWSLIGWYWAVLVGKNVVELLGKNAVEIVGEVLTDWFVKMITKEDDREC